MNGPVCINAVLEHLKLEDVQMLLANRGLPSVGSKEELTECLQVSILVASLHPAGSKTPSVSKLIINPLQSALREEICEWEWERCDVPGYHAGEPL